MSRNTLSMLIAAALFGAGPALAQTTTTTAPAMAEHTVDVDGDGVIDAVVRVREDVELVTVVERARTVQSTPVEADGLTLNERQIDVDNDNVPDAVLRVRHDVDMMEALDALADLGTEPVDARTGSDVKDAAVDVDLATREAGAVAATDREGERTGGELRTRTLDRSAAEAAAVDRQMDDLDDDVDVTVQSDDDLRASADLDADVHDRHVADVNVDVDPVDADVERDTVYSVDASTVAKTEPDDMTMAETPHDRLEDAELATAGAAAVGQADRVGERIGGELRTRTYDRSSVEAEAVRGADTVAIDDDTRVRVETDPDVAVSTDLDRDLDADTRVTERGVAVASDADLDADVDVVDGEPKDAFAQTAGTEGFSDGQTAAQAANRFARLDSDSDGALEETELRGESQLATSFEAYDINEDGEISENEFQSWYAAVGQHERTGTPDSLVADADMELDPEPIDADDADVDVDADVGSAVAQDTDDELYYEDDE